ncbi:tripartite tricarboxylate transporter TctB family protein [Noviherbaspirillum denitrificans]|uniref:Small permease of tripartite tricarboxylate transporter n=1 Tax=Noviherbaspirillum denitrificans TaxID=1968433 RepID=A0A254TAW6_9BURK|nr:tripartite tricarboxylate transporter TctB family protein [Noviherbaspirillum denitrificans]OWW19791.1 small permease of tripartite tricarboxylate transporter [Noviherbaspirillum denitrificans]
MPSFIRDPKDFWSGVIFIIVGLAAVIIGRDYSMGTAGRMGPAYFPTILGGILTLIGLVGVGRSMFKSGEGIGRFAVRENALILVATVLFGVLIRGAGLAVAVVVLVMISGYASVKFKVVPFLAVAVGLAVFAVLVFTIGLGLPMPMFGPWLGF